MNKLASLVDTRHDSYLQSENITESLIHKTLANMRYCNLFEISQDFYNYQILNPGEIYHDIFQYLLVFSLFHKWQADHVKKRIKQFQRRNFTISVLKCWTNSNLSSNIEIFRHILVFLHICTATQSHFPQGAKRESV